MEGWEEEEEEDRGGGERLDVRGTERKKKNGVRWREGQERRGLRNIGRVMVRIKLNQLKTNTNILRKFQKTKETSNKSVENDENCSTCAVCCHKKS